MPMCDAHMEASRAGQMDPKFPTEWSPTTCTRPRTWRLQVPVITSNVLHLPPVGRGECTCPGITDSQHGRLRASAWAQNDGTGRREG